MGSETGNDLEVPQNAWPYLSHATSSGGASRCTSCHPSPGPYSRSEAAGRCLAGAARHPGPDDDHPGAHPARATHRGSGGRPARWREHVHARAPGPDSDLPTAHARHAAR